MSCSVFLFEGAYNAISRRSDGPLQLRKFCLQRLSRNASAPTASCTGHECILAAKQARGDGILSRRDVQELPEVGSKGPPAKK